MGGKEKKVETADFAGGKITTIMGGTDLDLRDCQLRPGRNELDIVCVMGGVDLKVPPHWNVRLEVSPIMGGVDDKRNNIEISDPDSILVIKGYCMFGGLEVRS